MTENFRNFLASNPHLGAGPKPSPQPTAAVVMETVRSMSVGGELLKYVQSEQLLYFEQLYRVIAPRGLFNASPTKPLTFTMGAFRVPRNQVLAIVDYNFDIYRFSGAAAGDFVPLEKNRLPTQIGWDININQNRPGSLSYQIVPQVQTQNNQQYASGSPLQPAENFVFEALRAQELQGPAGPALSMMPQRHHRNGLVKVNNNYLAKSGETVNVTCSVINSVPIPLAFFEANICGILLSQNVYAAYQAANTPTGNPMVPVMPGASAQ